MYTPPSLPDTQALTDFRENTAAVLKRLTHSDRPLLLTQKGKAAGVVMSTRVYEQLAEAAALSRSIEAVRQGLRDFEAGRAVDAEKVLNSLEQRIRRKPRSEG